MRNEHGRDHWIAPSILSADFARLGAEVDAVLDAGADLVHFDVMDNHYVPNLTIGPLVCEALRKFGIKAPIDVHLMVKPVDRIIPDFAAAGASYISIHPEASEHVDRTLQLIREHGCKSGLVFNPATLAQLARACARQGRPRADHVRESGVRRPTVHRGRARRRSRPRARSSTARGRPIRLEVDGGVKVANIGRIAAAGADTFVAGSAIFGSKDYKATIAALRREIASTV